MVPGDTATRPVARVTRRRMKTDEEMPADTGLRPSTYLNNPIEQDHRGVKRRIGLMLGFELFRTPAVMIVGIEFTLRIQGGRFGPRRLHPGDRRAPAVRDAVLAAQQR
jgi:transposase-like protein